MNRKNFQITAFISDSGSKNQASVVHYDSFTALENSLYKNKSVKFKSTFFNPQTLIPKQYTV